MKRNPSAELRGLDYLLGECQQAVEPEMDLLMPRTWRLHPDITAFTSEVFYRNRLRSAAGLERQRLAEGGPVSGAGLRWISVEHTGNRSESAEEARAVARLVEELLEARPTCTVRHGARHTLTLDDILVIAPYNAQVGALGEALPEAARIGTVDKFQGQQAPVVIYSMASSSPEDAPRGMTFLYSANRLNVATSRAKCLAVVVGSPALFQPECRTPEQMRLANGFCRLREVVG